MQHKVVPSGRRRFAVIAALAVLTSMAVVPLSATGAFAADGDLARAGTASASMAQDDKDGSFPASNLIDGDPATRWASGNGPDEDAPFEAWAQVDLGTTAAVDRVVLAWEAAYATGYTVQVATDAPDDAASWKTVDTVTAGDGGEDAITLAEPVQARYVRVAMTHRVGFTWDPARTHWYGYSLFALEVYGTPAQVGAVFGGAPQVAAGETASVPIVLAAPVDVESSVRVRSTGGSAVAGTDYTAVDEVVTIPAGQTATTVSVATADRGPLAPVQTVELTLSDPTGGLMIGGRSTTQVTILPHGDMPDVGAVTVLDGFEDGVPTGYTTWGARAEVTPVLTAPATERAGAPADNHALVATVAGPAAAGDWFGFTHDIPATDWSAHDGFAFWFLGTGKGGTLRFELKSDGQLFERKVADDTAGWRQVNVAFSQLRLKDNPASDARFDPSASTGFAVTLTDLGAGTWTFDDIALYDRVSTVDDFEGDVPIAAPGSTTGLFTWGSDGATVSMAVSQRDREGGPADNHVLGGEYKIPGGGWGGFSHNLEATQDWSSYRGIRLLWYASQDNRPASPTAGDDIVVEIKDGGADAEHAELWRATFKDNWSPEGGRWKVVDLPFDEFTLSANQPGDDATKNGTLDLTAAWGYALSLPAGTAVAVPWAVDDVQLYGSAKPAPVISVSAADVTLVDPGATASVPVSVKTTDGQPLTADVTVAYVDKAGTAKPGTNYDPVSGTLTFPAGTASGEAQNIDVVTHVTAAEDESRSLTLELTPQGAAVKDMPRVVLNAVGFPYLDASRTPQERAADLLGRMTEAEKIGQMAQAERLGLKSPTQIAELGLGSVLSGGGSVPRDNTPAGWADMVDGFQRQAMSTRLQIPLIYGVDAVHGHNNVVGATILPHNTSLGATRDPALVEALGKLTAEEVRGTGIPWTFAPCLCVTRDERWGRSYESFSEDPALVAQFAGPAVTGLQGADPNEITGSDEVLTTIKHWVGDGDTTYVPELAGSGYPIDQGVTRVKSMDELMRLAVDPYKPAIAAGAGSAMPSYSGVSIDGGDVVRMHENTALNTDLLKGDLGFKGFLVSDWEGIDKLPGTDYADKVARSVNSGLDMAMAPYNFATFIDAVTKHVADGKIPASRVDDAALRILTQKFALGLFDKPFADRSGADSIGSAEHRALARTAAAESQVLMKNSDHLLPLSPTAKVYLAGSNADDLGNQMGGWTISWQGGSGETTTTGTSIRAGIAAVAPDAQVTYSKDASAPIGDAQVGVVVVGERPYAEGVGDVGNNGHSLELSAADKAAIDTVCAAVPCAVLVVAGRPQVVSGQLDAIDALVASWLPGSEGAGVADTLFGAKPFTGRLPVSWPAAADAVPVNVGDADYAPAYAYGWGLRTDAPRDRLAAAVESLPEGEARTAVQAALDAKVWGSDGSVSDPATLIGLLAVAGGLLPGTELTTAHAADLVVSVVRDLAQAAMVAGADVPTDAVARSADAEHLLASGDPAAAIEKLASVVGAEAQPGMASKTALKLSRNAAPFGTKVTATVTVKVDGADPTGTVAVLVDGEQAATATIDGARRNSATVNVALPVGTAVGAHTVTAVYAGAGGTPRIEGSTSEDVQLKVTRAAGRLSTSGTDWFVSRRADKAVHLQLAPVADVVPTGSVQVWVGGRSYTAQLGPDGTATVELPRSTRTALVVASYSGDATFAPSSVLRILIVI